MRDMEGPRMVSKEAKIPAMAISKRVGHFIDSGPSSTDFIVISRLTVVIPACWGWQNNSCPSALNHYPAILGGHIQWLWMGRTFHAHSNLFLTSEKILNHRKRPNKEIALNNEENQVCLVYTHKHARAHKSPHCGDREADGWLFATKSSSTSFDCQLNGIVWILYIRTVLFRRFQNTTTTKTCGRQSTSLFITSIIDSVTPASVQIHTLKRPAADISPIWIGNKVVRIAQSTVRIVIACGSPRPQQKKNLFSHFPLIQRYPPC